MVTKIEKKTVYTALFILIALCQLYVESFRINIFLQLGILGFCALLEPIRFSNRLYQHLASIVMVLLIGLIGMAIHRYGPSTIFKDLFHFIKPILGLLLGYTFFKRIGDFRMFAKTVVIASVVTALIHFGIIVLFTDFMSGSIEQIRLYTRDNFLEIFGLFLLVYFPKFEGSEIFEKHYYKWICMVVLSVSAFLYFSRTMIVIAAVLWLAMKGYTRITQQGLKAISIVILLIGLFYVYLYNANIKRGATGLEGFLYKVKIVPEELFTFNIDREDHADLWDHWRGYEAKRALELMNDHPSSYLFGTGHGSLVDLKFYAPLTGDKKGIRFISELHNGYIYLLYKTGILGLLIYIFVLLRWYAYIYKSRNLANVLISAAGIIFLMTTVMITGMYNSKDIIIFIVGGMFWHLHLKERKRLS
ncbi:O-antigen ligase family protein [Flavobacterium sp. MFBS3-15]|uniref:O-antigen ligase family protein n=1 Tax=Flavobacterium sp. MFBS3-15 TaxID=2989816 RepID=UPI0022361AE3|nr:O-antigen ligase family protein [Flavobacterium sp. MFBS3-15]MCW4469155.1 O-antigen ligase family protein [Flavobacterium sp. MFBS3-15]